MQSQLWSLPCDKTRAFPACGALGTFPSTAAALIPAILVQVAGFSTETPTSIGYVVVLYQRCSWHGHTAHVRECQDLGAPVQVLMGSLEPDGKEGPDQESQAGP